MQRPWRSAAAYWLAPHGLFSLLYYRTQGWHHPQRAGPSHINHWLRKYTTGLPRGQCCGSISAGISHHSFTNGCSCSNPGPLDSRTTPCSHKLMSWEGSEDVGTSDSSSCHCLGRSQDTHLGNERDTQHQAGGTQRMRKAS